MSGSSDGMPPTTSPTKVGLSTSHARLLLGWQHWTGWRSGRLHTCMGCRTMDLGHDRLGHDDVAMLLARCAQADADAFRRLYVVESARLFGLALRITQNRALAGAVLHDTMLQAWRNAGQFDPLRGTGRGWLTALLRYRAIDAAARVKRDLGPTEPPDLKDPAPNLFERLSASRDALTLARCLETIEQRPRSLVTAAYLGGLTYAELAARTGEPLGTVKSTIRRALRALRACMENPP